MGGGSPYAANQAGASGFGRYGSQALSGGATGGTAPVPGYMGGATTGQGMGGGQGAGMMPGSRQFNPYQSQQGMPQQAMGGMPNGGFPNAQGGYGQPYGGGVQNQQQWNQQRPWDPMGTGAPQIGAQTDQWLPNYGSATPQYFNANLWAAHPDNPLNQQGSQLDATGYAPARKIGYA